MSDDVYNDFLQHEYEKVMRQLQEHGYYRDYYDTNDCAAVREDKKPDLCTEEEWDEFCKEMGLTDYD